MTQEEQQNQQKIQTQEQTQKKQEQNYQEEEQKQEKEEENTSLVHTKIQPTYDPETGGLIFYSEEEEKLKSNQKKNNVNPYDVQIVDYNKLVDDFGCSLITREQVKKIENLTKVPAHPWLKREIFFSHRDLDVILNEYEKGNKFYLYTGRGPSGDRMHLGHLMPFIFTKYLQDAFNVPLVIQLTDDEKFFHKGETTLEEYQRMGIENAKDIIACGFDVDKTFIFLDTEYIGHMYMNVCKFQKNITYNQLKGIFGVNQSDIIGKMSYPAIQAAPALSSSFKHIFGDKIVPCLVPQGIDQDAYFRMTRDVCQRLKVPKTACIHNKFFPALQGFNSKMSTSDPNSAIFLTDTPQEIKDKINKHAFSGGQQTKELQEKFGANLEVDIPYQYLNFFLNDEAELKKIGEDYSSGKILTSAVKGKLIELLQKIISEHQEKRAKVTDEQVRKFMEIRKLNF